MPLSRSFSLVALTLLATPCRTIIAQQVEGKKPNIVIILADDVGTGDIPFYWEDMGASMVQMPHLQALANKGIMFTDAHSTPLCAPSRYMLLSGNYAHRGSKHFGTWSLNDDSSQFTKYQKSIAETLRGAGYKTGAFGKWHMGAKISPNGIQSDGSNHKEKTKYIISEELHDWSLPLERGPTDLGFDRSYTSDAGIQAPPYVFFRNDYLTIDPSQAFFWGSGSHQMPEGESKIPKHWPGEGDPNWDSSAFDMIVVEETEKFIDDHLASNRSEDPFFAYVALGAVHDPHSPPDFFLDGSKVKDVHQTSHLDMLGAMDKAVGAVVSMIEDKGLAGETIIIFASDNGGLKNRSSWTGHKTSGPLRGAKKSIFEGGHRVPLIFRYDGKFQAGRKRGRMVGLNDIYATICELVGIEVPLGSAQDSVSFAKYTIRAKDRQGLRKYLGMFLLKGKQWQHAIRKGNIKLIHTPHNNTFQAYNLKWDIAETNNVINKPWVQKQLPELFEKLKEIGPCPDKDHSGSFLVAGTGINRNCQWFQQNKERCELHTEGELFCPSICTRFLAKCNQKKMYLGSLDGVVAS